MMNHFHKWSLCFGAGAMAGAIAVIALWVISELFGQYFSFLKIHMGIEAFYAPLLWGGIGGLGYLLPLNSITWKAKSFAVTVFPSFCYLGHQFPWVQNILNGKINLSGFLQPEVFSTFIIFYIVWAVVTSNALRGH